MISGPKINPQVRSMIVIMEDRGTGAYLGGQARRRGRVGSREDLPETVVTPIDMIISSGRRANSWTAQPRPCAAPTNRCGRRLTRAAARVGPGGDSRRKPCFASRAAAGYRWHPAAAREYLRGHAAAQRTKTFRSLRDSPAALPAAASATHLWPCQHRQRAVGQIVTVCRRALARGGSVDSRIGRGLRAAEDSARLKAPLD